MELLTAAQGITNTEGAYDIGVTAGLRQAVEILERLSGKKIQNE